MPRSTIKCGPGRDPGKLTPKLMRAVLGRILTRDANAIDVGAHLGRTLALMTELAPRGLHAAFEPDDERARRLANRFPRVRVHAAALSDRDGQTPYYHDADRPELSSIIPRLESSRITRQVPCRRLDGLLDHLPRVDLIHIDVHGAELGVLRGAMAVIERDRPAIVFDSSPYRTHGIDLLWLELRSGYEIWPAAGFAKRRSPLDWDEFELAHRYPFGPLVFVAMPRDPVVNRLTSPHRACLLIR